MAHEFDGNKYKAASAHQKEWGAKLIRELNIAGSERILDLGCGDGALTAQLAALAPQGSVLGIDASRGMIETAKTHVAGNLSFAVRDINDLDFENEFDIVFSNAALHWIKDHDALLGNVHRALKPGGMLKFNFAGDGNCANFFDVVKDAIRLLNSPVISPPLNGRGICRRSRNTNFWRSAFLSRPPVCPAKTQTVILQTGKP